MPSPPPQTTPPLPPVFVPAPAPTSAPPANQATAETRPPADDTAPTPTTTAPEPESIIINWLTDLDEARLLATAAGKDMLVAFVSTDSNTWSQRLDAEAFSRPAFAVSANKHFVCVMIDFPKTYSLPAEQSRKNAELRKDWGVRSYPTVVLADETGRPYAVTGYRNVGASDYAHHLENLRTLREQRDQYMAAAAHAAGIDRAILLAKSLRGIDEDVLLRHYGPELAELKSLDPGDSTGLIGDIEFTPKINALRERIIRLIRQQKNYQGALDAVDSFILQNAPAGEHLQKALFLKLHVYANNDVRNHTAILQLMDHIIAINPVSEQGMMAVDVRARANALLESTRKATTTPEQ